MLALIDPYNAGYPRYFQEAAFLDRVGRPSRGGIASRQTAILDRFLIGIYRCYRIA